MNIGDISIIAVDDDEAMLGLLRRSLGGAGSFEAYAGSEEFLKGAKLGGCDILITDINLPGAYDGIALTRHVKAAAPQCDVLVMTGEATLDNALAAMKAGAYDFLKKPFSVDHLESSLYRCVEKRRMSSELRALKAAQEELAAAYSQLKSSERMKEAFLSVIGHELRTPLAKILAGTELLRGSCGGRGDAVLDAVVAGASALDAVIDSLILYADLRKEDAPPRLEQVDLEAVARSVAEELSGKAAENGVSLSFRGPGKGVVVNGEPLLLRNAVKRLGLNAIVFNIKGGRAEIAVQDGTAAASVTVTDSGIGIPEELVSGLGTPFYQIADHMTRKTGGLGLGLAIVKQVVESHNGTFSVRNREGGGTAFTVSFPKGPPAAPPPSAGTR